MRHTFNNVNPIKLVDELLTKVQLISATSLEDTLYIEFSENTDMSIVKQIVETHNPTPLPKPLTEIEKLRLEQAQANAEMFEMVLKMTGGNL